MLQVSVVQVGTGAGETLGSGPATRALLVRTIVPTSTRATTVTSCTRRRAEVRRGDGSAAARIRALTSSGSSAIPAARARRTEAVTSSRVSSLKGARSFKATSSPSRLKGHEPGAHVASDARSRKRLASSVASPTHDETMVPAGRRIAPSGVRRRLRRGPARLDLAMGRALRTGRQRPSFPPIPASAQSSISGRPPSPGTGLRWRSRTSRRWS